VPGFARAHCHGDGTPIRPGPSGKKAGEDVPPGLSRHRLSQLICRRPTSAVSGNREPASPACRALHSGTVRLRHAGPGTGYGGQLKDAPVDAARKVSTEKCRLSSTTGLSPPGAAGNGHLSAAPASPYHSMFWPAVQASQGALARAAGTGDEIAHRALVGDLAEPTTAESARLGFADVSQRGLRPPEDSPRSAWSSCPRRYGRPGRQRRPIATRPSTPHLHSV